MILELNGFKYEIGDTVQKKRNSKWRGKVVGFYSTEVTECGYCVESYFEKGSVQVWPEQALIPWEEPDGFLDVPKYGDKDV